MKKKLLGLFVTSMILWLLPITVAAESVEPRGFIELKQPTNQIFKAEIRGDEWLSYAVVENTNELLLFGTGDYWYYATLEPDTKHLVPTDKKYKLDSKPNNAAHESDLSTIEIDIPEVKVTEPKSARNLSTQQNRNLLVVMIEFNDTPLEFSKTDWYNKVFASGHDSVNDYYQEATKGLVQFNPIKNTQSENVDGVIKVKLNKNHPNSGFISDNDGKYTLPRSMINEAINQEKESLNLKQYDTNNDKIISPSELHVLAIFSGYSASATFAGSGITPTIWPHRWGGEIKVDGLNIQTYTAVSDKRKYRITDKDEQATIGTFVHELGHDLGLPDLYNPAGAAGSGLGRYSVMSDSHTTMNGKPSGYYPVHFDAYSKVKLGVVTPTVITDESSISVNEIQQADFNILKIETADPKQYYLIENRQMKGFDAALASYIHSGGIGIYYVNENITNNQGYGAQIVTLREADEAFTGYSKLSEKQTNGLDGFYYKGQGMYRENQSTRIAPYTIPNNSDDSSEGNFILDVVSESKDKMMINFSSLVGIDEHLKQGYFSDVINDSYFEDFPLSSQNFGQMTSLEMKFFRRFSLHQPATSLSGIEKATNIEQFDTGMSNFIVDYSPLKYLTKMTHLQLRAYHPVATGAYQRDEVDPKLLEPLALDFLSDMTDLESLDIISRDTLDLRPLSKLSNLKTFTLGAMSPILDSPSIKVSTNENGVISIPNPIQYSSQFTQASITAEVQDDSYNSFDATANKNNITIANVTPGTDKIILHIYSDASDDNGQKTHSLYLNIPLVWE